MSKTLVIVESPAKARTIGRFLGSKYEVHASFGHVRDLPESSSQIPEAVKKEKWARLGVNVDADFEPIYVVSSDKDRHVKELRKHAKDATEILLATDEDREGESISWHILQLLKPKKSIPVRRIVFHEITPEAIQDAIASPRELDMDLVKAQETRRILDRLYGYTLSPLLWRKVAPKLSAGRVQSVATRLVVLRERERRAFVSAEYWAIEADLAVAAEKLKMSLLRVGDKRAATGANFNAQGELADDSHWLKRDEAPGIAERLLDARPWTITLVEAKEGKENPPPPFMTSTLQQAANRRLGFPARRTMQVAQQLYEGIDLGQGSTGLITYMRTDSLTLAGRAVQQIRQVAAERYGKDYVPAKPNTYASKAKNAQEAHEAIRPTDMTRTPESVRSRLNEEQYKLYSLIWRQTMACQMTPAKVERTRVEAEVADQGRALTFGASGKTILFPGFLAALSDGVAAVEDRETILPLVKEKQQLEPARVEALEKHTQPPARYNEASLVRKLEEEGVGRPSTYASILSTIQDRGYIFKKGKELVPTFTAFAVTELLETGFSELVDLQFTAKMEEELDEIADGQRDMVTHLKKFYHGQEGGLGIQKLVDEKGPDLPYPHIPLGGGIVARIGRNGPFLQEGEGEGARRASIPEDMPPAELTEEAARALLDDAAKGPASLGEDPETGRPIFLKKGRFGPYLEMEPAEGEEPRRVSLPPGQSAAEITPEDASQLLRFPFEMGAHPELNEPVKMLLGRYGAYLTCGEKSANVGDWRAALEMSLEDAVAALAAPPKRGRGAAAPKEPLAKLGTFEGIEGEIKVLDGRFGPYVTNGTVNATLPRGTDPTSLTLEQAAELIKAKAAQGPSKKKPVRRKKK